jgi:hypothetical protein
MFNSVFSQPTKKPINICAPCETLSVKYSTETENNLSDRLKHFTLSENEQTASTETTNNLFLTKAEQAQELSTTKRKETLPAYETHQPINSHELTDIKNENETQQAEEKNLLKNNEQHKSTTTPVLKTEQKILQQAEDNIPYKWIKNKLLRQIEGIYLNKSQADMIQTPLRYWSYEQAKYINWINIRFRCLIESLIRISNYSSIDAHTILCLNDAFVRLIKSNAYIKLPETYPYKKLIADLCSKINQIAAKNKHLTKIVLRLPLERKAQLIAIRYQMLESVPAMKFSEIDFIEEKSLSESYQVTQAAYEPKERIKKDWQYKYEAMKRERALHKAA